MRGAETTATFKLPEYLNKEAVKPEAKAAKVLGEDRSVEIAGGAICDAFAPWAVHLYQIPQ
jgi:hypothetical protein